MRALSWRVSRTEVGEIVRDLLPDVGHVAVGGQQAMALMDRPDLRVDDIPGRWSWGRAFCPEWEVLWRCEGEDASIVLVGNAPADPPAGAEELRGAGSWKEIRHRPDRPPRLLLWHRDDLRLPREPVLPRSLSGHPALEIQVREYEDGESVVWTRYLRVAPWEGRDGDDGG
ncbi:MAG: hypothetical protein E6J41_26515 [Chloroflexi bacterium]|nr:MAG: hypothetical protein E6J41_26515 [Chloroflexota bacterium]